MEEFNDPKPFIKWAGGKDKLYSQLERWMPIDITKGGCKTYYEPFLGGGAVFFNLARSISFDNIVLSDINEELILVYKVVQRNAWELIELLDQYKYKYSKLSNIDKEKLYYDMRSSYNNQRFNINHKKYSESWTSRAAQMIFLNKTCYNGLFRQNMRGEFNVPFGKNYHPNVYDPQNIEAVSKLLVHAEIITSDFGSVLDNVPGNSFVYLDPPYRPISKTSNFTDYYKLRFTEKDNDRLIKQLNILDNNNVKFMLNNSFPLNDEYIKKHYENYSVNIITANRMMSGVSGKRGKVSEIVVTNY